MIDWNRLAELKSEVGEEDFGEIVDLFLEETDEVMDRIKISSAADLKEDDLHFLKGSSMNLGFATFSTLCASAEKAAAAGASDQIDVSQLVATYYAAKDSLLSHEAARAS